MSDWKPVLDELDTSDDGRQMEAMIDKLDEKQRAKQFAARVEEAVAALEPSQRKLLELAVFERKSRAEIMAELGIAERTLRQRVHDLEKKIQKSLGNIRRPPPVLGYEVEGRVADNRTPTVRRGSGAGLREKSASIAEPLRVLPNGSTSQVRV